jgi:hypothetical protein
MINDGITRRDPVLFCGLLDRFLLDQKQEQEAEQITHNTLASYRSMISQQIRPKWGDAYLEDVRPALDLEMKRKAIALVKPVPRQSRTPWSKDPTVLAWLESL